MATFSLSPEARRAALSLRQQGWSDTQIIEAFRIHGRADQVRAFLLELQRDHDAATNTTWGLLDGGAALTSRAPTNRFRR